MAGQDNIRVRGDIPSWRWVVVGLALAQAAAPLVAGALAPNFLVEDPAREAAITPSGYAFAIWGLICLSSLVTAVAMVRFGLGAPWERRALVDIAVVFAGFSTWLYAAAQDWLWGTVVIFATMFAALLDVVRLLVRDATELLCPRWLASLATATFGLYLGWTTIAVFVNAAAALIAGGWSATSTLWQLVLLLAAAATAVFLVGYLQATPGYVAGVVWALVAAAIGAFSRDAAALGLTAAAACAGVVLAAAQSLRGGQRSC